MRILVIHEYNLPYGGGEQYLQSVCQALREMGHRVALVCAQDRNQGFLPADACYGIERSFGFRTGWRVLSSVENILDRERPDVVFLNGLGRLFVSPLIIRRIVQGWPSVSFVHHLDLICPTGRKVIPGDDQACAWPMGQSCLRKGCVGSMGGPLIDRLRVMAIGLWRMWTMRHCRVVIVPSQYVQRECIRNGFPPERLRVLSYFTAKGRGPVNDPVEPRILWVGRGEAGKGLDEFLRSLARLPDRAWRAVVVGDGSGLADAVGLAAQLGLSDRVAFLGRVAGEELDAWYASSRLLVFSSTWAETFGQVGIEAMAFGRPVVAFDVGGSQEWLVDGRSGFLVPREDTVGLADRMASLLADDDLCRRMGRAGREYVDQRFRPEHHLLSLVEIFHEAVRLHRGPGNGAGGP